LRRRDVAITGNARHPLMPHPRHRQCALSIHEALDDAKRTGLEFAGLLHRARW